MYIDMSLTPGQTQEPLVFPVLAFNYKVFAGFCEHAWIKVRTNPFHTSRPFTKHKKTQITHNFLPFQIPISSANLDCLQNWAVVDCPFQQTLTSQNIIFSIVSFNCASLASNQTSNCIVSTRPTRHWTSQRVCGIQWFALRETIANFKFSREWQTSATPKTAYFKSSEASH